MLTIIFSVIVSAGVYCLARFGIDISVGWSIFLGLIGFGAMQAILGLFIQKKVKVDMDNIQSILLDGQKRISAKMQRWQFRPPGSIQAAQKEIFEDTKVFVKQALAATETLRKYRFFVPLIERQQATAQVQLNWMIKEFSVVDKLLPKALFLDPMMSAIKMSRMYMLNEPMDNIEKVYKKAVRRLKYNQNALLAAQWSWMQVQKGEIDGAFKTLTEALKSSDNATLKANHELLMNNRPGHFSNSSFGDQWYSLYLEEPRVRTQRQHQVYR